MDIGTKRRTGRTTRMLDEAIETLLEGDDVLIVGADRVHTNYLRWVLYERADSMGFNVRSLPEHRCILATPAEAEFNWTSMCSVKYPTYITYVDHFTVEMRWAGVLLAWTRYDDEPWVQPPPAKDGLPPPRERRLILKKKGDATP